jgi:release factor glutamine methyltransferase
MRIQQALRDLAAIVAEGGVETPAREARLLLAHAMDVPHERLVLMAHDELDPAIYERAITYCMRRSVGEPTSLIRGYRDFYGRAFTVTEDVLDPRPETEILVAEALTQPFETLLDLGTGSGCILISLLAERPGASGIGADLSEAALQVAERNAKDLGVLDRAAFLHSDWFSGVGGTYDLIVSNPPYISDAEMTELSREVLNHDPHMALTPGGDGLSPYRILAAEAQAYLRPRGRILCEIGWTQGPEVTALFAAADWADVRLLPDLDGRDRVLVATRQ